MTVAYTDISTDLLQDYEALLEAFMQEIVPDADVANGSALHELLIRPAAAFYAKEDMELEDLRNQYSLTLLSATEDPNETVAENLAANFKVTRNEGTLSYGEIAVFTDQTSPLYIPVDLDLTAAGISLTVTKTYVGVTEPDDYTDTDLTEYRKLTSYSDGTYIFTVPVQTLTATAAIIDEGTAVSSSAAIPHVTSMQVISAVSGGSSQETIAALGDRGINGITAKVPSGKQHITALLEEAELPVNSVEVFGMGDTEMLRDQNNVGLISMGGRTDVYTRTAQLPTTRLVIKTAQHVSGNTWQIDIDEDDSQGFYYVSTIEHPSNTRTITNAAEIAITFRAVPGTADGSPEVPTPGSARYSIYQAATIQFEYPGLGSTDDTDFRLYLVTMPSLSTVQSYMLQDGIRNRCQDNLVKAPVPCFVGMSLTMTAAEQASTVDVTDIQNHIAEYVNTMVIGTPFLSAADLAVSLKGVFT